MVDVRLEMVKIGVIRKELFWESATNKAFENEN